MPGVGEKTAARLITTYGDLDGIYAHLDELTPKLRQSLADARGRRCGPTPWPSRWSATSTVDVDPDDAAIGGWDPEELRRLFDFLEFRTLWDRFLDATGGDEGNPSPGRVGAALEMRSSRSSGRRPRGLHAPHRLAGGGRPLAVAGAWEGRQGRSALAGLAFAAATARPRTRSSVVWLGDALLGRTPSVRAALGWPSRRRRGRRRRPTMPRPS